jgi:hypothetical protein
MSLLSANIGDRHDGGMKSPSPQRSREQTLRLTPDGGMHIASSSLRGINDVSIKKH